MSLDPLHILAILASPRRGGNSEQMLDRALAGAQAAGAQTEKVVLRDLWIGPCYECRGCDSGEGCVREDDMQLLYPKLTGTPRLIIATPIFFMGLPGQLKMMIDRMQALWARKYRLRRDLDPLPEGRRGYLIAAASRQVPEVFDAAKLETKAFLHVIDTEYAGELLVPGLEDASAALRHPTALAEAYELGRKVAA